MQLDMHFYAVYALARAAGIKAEAAAIVAHASQFVDDALEDEAIVLEDERGIIPTMTSHRPIDYQNTIPGDQWKVWVPFHFLPGNDDGANTFVEKMVCRKDSPAARRILDYALGLKSEAFGLHLGGISAHVYADTFSHYGFVGLSRQWNKVESNSIKANVESSSIFNYIKTKYETFKTRVAGVFAETVPVGHGAVATYPDRPYLNWEYTYESGETVERNNVEDYMEACVGLHRFFGELVENNSSHGDPDGAMSWDTISDRIRNIVKQEAPLEERIKLWQDAISSDELFEATDRDKAVSYSETAWRSARIVYHFSRGGTVDDCNGCLFIRAAWRYRHYVLQELLPSIGVII